MLVDTATTFSMTGGRRLLRVAVATEDISSALQAVLDGPEVDALIVVEASDLMPRAPVRKLCEGDTNAAVIPCYGDDAATLANLIKSVGEQFNLNIERDAETFLLEFLGADRAASRAELEKLALYVGDGETVSLNDAVTVIGDGAALSIDEIVYAMTDDDKTSLDRHITRAFNDGTAPITLLRAAMRHLQRMHFARGAVEAGLSTEQAQKSLRPPVMFFHEARFRRALNSWSVNRLARALSILTDAEIECKSTGLPDEEICSRALIRIANGAHQGTA